MTLRVLTWNLLHGRSVPPAGHNLMDEFAAALGCWRWDVALLQETPPWWPSSMAARLGAEARIVLTSRNSLLPLRRAVAVRRPDLIKSNGGGANAILVRAPAAIEDHRTLRLRTLPERRWLQAVRLRSGVWVANLHLTVRDEPAALEEARLAADTLAGWAADNPAVLAGDFNVRSLSPPGFSLAGGYDVDLVFARGLAATSSPEILDRGRLSDHAPVVVELA
jgi:endonuclease/exonuclease/phosphatase family metal-dependent hydrolase